MDRTERIWLEFHDKLLSFISRRVNNNSCAEDILQDVFLKIHNNIQRLRADDKIESWIYQITRNAIIDHYRVSKNHSKLPDELESLPPCEDDNIREELSDCITSMIRNLPEKYRIAVQLSDVEGKPQKELTKLEKISLPGAKSRIQRGRVLLKKMFLDCCQLESDRNNKIIDCHPNGSTNKCC